MSTDLNASFNEQYMNINMKMKKRFMRKPNVSEATNEFIALAVQCEHSEQPAFAGHCYVGAAKCEASVGNFLGEAEHYMAAGRQFMKAEKKLWSLRFCSPDRENLEVLIALAFYASGSYQMAIGHSSLHNVSQNTVSKAVRQVTYALNTIYSRHVKWPIQRYQRNNIKARFYQKFGIPGVLGCIDGTHISIIRPQIHEERYYNRKGYHSLNTMIICDSDLNILCVDPSNPGSSHDSSVWQNHPLHQHLYNLCENGEQGYLLGDSGYPLRKFLMTPILNTVEGTPDHNYYAKHVIARNTIERCIGVLKARFRCLLSARALHYNPVTAGKIVNACCILHNIANATNMPVPTMTQEEIHSEDLHMQQAAIGCFMQAMSKYPEKSPIRTAILMELSSDLASLNHKLEAMSYYEQALELVEDITLKMKSLHHLLNLQIDCGKLEMALETANVICDYKIKVPEQMLAEVQVSRILLALLEKPADDKKPASLKQIFLDLMNDTDCDALPINMDLKLKLQSLILSNATGDSHSLIMVASDIKNYLTTQQNELLNRLLTEDRLDKLALT